MTFLNQLPTLLIAMPGGLEWIALIFLGLPFYFAPFIVALGRKSQSTTGVFLLNFFLGWTGLGWIGAMIYAIASPANQERVLSSTQESA